MLAGLHAMEESSRKAFCEELELEGADTAALLTNWMADQVGAKLGDDEGIERGVLSWLGSRLGLESSQAMSIDEMEAAVRRKIAEDSHDFLYPFMEVGSAVAYTGPRKVVGPKLEFLESSSAGLIPSHRAREKMRNDWQARGARLLAHEGGVDLATLMDILSEPISILKHAGPETRASVVTLVFAVALSDGRFELEEEQFAKALAEELEIPPQSYEEIKREFNQAFWKHLTELGGGVAKQRTTAESLTLSLRAAQLGLESCGGLASFSGVVERGFVGTLHSSMGAGSRFGKAMSSWGKTPLRLPLGFATGMLCYIRSKWKSDDQEALLRLSLAAIFKQHLKVAADVVEITEDDVDEYLPQSEVENPADVLAETVVGTRKQEPVRKITLEPLNFEKPQ